MQRLPAAQRQQKRMLMDVLQMHEQKHTPQLHWDTELHQSSAEIFLFILPVITSCKGENKNEACHLQRQNVQKDLLWECFQNCSRVVFISTHKTKTKGGLQHGTKLQFLKSQPMALTAY